MFKQVQHKPRFECRYEPVARNPKALDQGTRERKRRCKTGVSVPTERRSDTRDIRPVIQEIRPVIQESYKAMILSPKEPHALLALNFPGITQLD